VALRHAVLAALLDGEASGYQLAKVFDVGVANFWYAAPQQLYAELARLERDGLVSGRQVRQEGRPDKRVFTVTAAGVEEVAAFAAESPKPLFLRDDLAVRVHAADHVDAAVLVDQLLERADEAAAKLAIFEGMLERLGGGLDEGAYLRRGERVGPYLTCLGGIRFEEMNRDWCLTAAEHLRSRVGGDR
jgi:DNA-binding PadR family transcriptional regulator